MSIDVLLAAFKDNLLRCSPALRFSNSVVIALVLSLIIFAECARLVFSAYIVTVEHFNAYADH